MAKTIPDLYHQLGSIISKMPPADRLTSSAQKFRLFMSFGQSYSQPGRLRNNFYREVIRRAKQVSTFDFLFYKIMMHHDVKILELSLATSSGPMEITESKDIIPMDTDDDRTSGMDTAEDRKIACNGSPIINFISAVCFLALICYISRMYRGWSAFESTSICTRAHSGLGTRHVFHNPRIFGVKTSSDYTGLR